MKKLYIILIILLILIGCKNNNKIEDTQTNYEQTITEYKEIEEEPVIEQKIIVIDPGHQEIGDSTQEPIGPGATETKAKVTTGATGVVTGQKESVLNLKVSTILKSLLENRNYKVIMTRNTNDINISNMKRAKIANNANADAFIRIHANSIDNENVRGVLTMCQTPENIYNGNLSNTSCNLSQIILNNIVKETNFQNKEITKTDTMSGLNWSKVPTTIVEMGFLSNPEEDKLLSTEEYQNKIATGIANGIDEYFKEN